MEVHLVDGLHPFLSVRDLNLVRLESGALLAAYQIEDLDPAGSHPRTMRFRLSTDDGDTWEPQAVNWPPLPDEPPRVVAHGDEIHLVSAFHYAVYTPGQGTEARPVPETEVMYDARLVDGALHAAVARPGTGRLLYAKPNGSSYELADLGMPVSAARLIVDDDLGAWVVYADAAEPAIYAAKREGNEFSSAVDLGFLTAAGGWNHYYTHDMTVDALHVFQREGVAHVAAIVSNATGSTLASARLLETGWEVARPIMRCEAVACMLSFVGIFEDLRVYGGAQPAYAYMHVARLELNDSMQVSTLSHHFSRIDDFGPGAVLTSATADAVDPNGEVLGTAAYHVLEWPFLEILYWDREADAVNYVQGGI